MAEGAAAFSGVLEVAGGGGDGSLIPILRFDIAESYNAGWQGRVVLAQRVAPGTSSGSFMTSMMGKGAIPGASASVHLTYRAAGAGEASERVVRTWPVGLGAIEPLETLESDVVACTLQVMDPVTYLTDRPIWGAYRACSVGEMVGGALSMAAGGNGKPTLTPAMPGLPAVTLTTAYRGSLDWVEYAIAVGRPLGEWLGEVAGLLGLRMEMTGTATGDVGVHVTDMRVTGESIAVRLPGASGTDIPVNVTGVYGQPSPPIRAAVLDDITQGVFHRVGGGSVGMVVEGLGVDADEVAARMVAAKRGRDAEMFTVSATTGTPVFRPGRVAVFNEPIRGVARWQVAGARHVLAGQSYENAVTLFDADIPWVPKQPVPGPDVVVPAVVDGGEDVPYHQPVPRDRMGRIPVRFSFLPAETAEEASARSHADSNEDGVVDQSDFGPGEFADTVHWEAEVEALRAGELDDLFPGAEDGELTDVELESRRERAERRRGAHRYLAFAELQTRQEADRDMDGHVTRRDALVSDDLRKALSDEDTRALLEQWQDSVTQGTLGEDFPDLGEDDLALVAEYGGLFGPDDQDDPDVRRAIADANAAAEKWPARLPLPVVNPMAGGLHGFIPSHRQGDACRVAVHGPFAADVVGFQYRDDRPINPEIERATAGLVVEHDQGSAWSGFVFRPTEELDP